MANIAEYFRQHLDRARYRALSPVQRRCLAGYARRRSRRARRPLAGRPRRAGSRHRAIASRSVSRTVSIGSRSTWPRSASAWSSSRSTSTTIRTTFPGAPPMPKRACWSSKPRAWPVRSRNAAPRCRRLMCCAPTRATPPLPSLALLPRDGRAPAVSRPARGCAGDDLLHLGHVGPAEGRDAVARQHHRQRRVVPRRPRWRNAIDTFLSILPLSHMFERTGGYYLPLSIGAKVVYARGVAQIADDLARAGADRDVRRAAHFRKISRAGRPVAGGVACEALAVRSVRGARLAGRTG